MFQLLFKLFVINFYARNNVYRLLYCEVPHIFLNSLKFLQLSESDLSFSIRCSNVVIKTILKAIL